MQQRNPLLSCLLSGSQEAWDAREAGGSVWVYVPDISGLGFQGYLAGRAQFKPVEKGVSGFRV